MHDPRCPRCHAQTEIDTRYCAACGHAFVGWRERAVDLLEPRLEGTPAWLRSLLALLLASLAGLSAGHLVTARGLYFIGSYALLGLVLLAFASYVGRVLAEGNRASLTGRLGRVFLASTIFGVGLFSVQLVDRVYIGSLMGTEHQGEIALPGIRALTIGHPDEALVSAATKRYDNVLHENKGLARFRSNTYVSEDGRLVTILLTESIDGIYSLVGLLLAASVALVAYRQAVEARAIRA